MQYAAVAGIMSDQFYEMTPAEVNICLDAFKMRQDMEWQRAAFMAATIINPFLKKPIAPIKLLKQDKPAKVVDFQKAKDDYYYLKQKFGA